MSIRPRFILPFVSAAVLLPTACGSNGSSYGSGKNDAGATDSGSADAVPGFDAGDDSSIISGRTLTGLGITPNQASIQSLNGAPSTQQFQAIGQFSDGTSAPVTGASWMRDDPQVGAIDGSGLYTAD